MSGWRGALHVIVRRRGDGKTSGAKGWGVQGANGMEGRATDLGLLLLAELEDLAAADAAEGDHT
jgi:hypothetical protein